MSSLLTAVMAGMLSGSVFVVAFGFAFYPPSDHLVLDKIEAPLDRGHTRQIIEIIENNATIAELYKKQYLILFHISERHQGNENCPFGSCANVFIQTQSGYLFVYVNYDTNRVVAFAEQKFRDFTYSN